jgi:putative chitinase
MTAALDRATFFAAARLNPFPGSLSASQVSGMEAILDACPLDTPLEHLAYDLGTCPIETAWTMLPIKEKGGTAYLAKMYDIRGDRPAKARELGNVNPGDGVAFSGRGYVQLTGRANYRKATQRLRALGLIGADQDLETNPDLAMHPDVAAAILFVGTREGWFTGKKLSDYLGAGRIDWIGARRIINGQDRAAEIALHAQAFAAALKRAGYVPGAVVTKIPTRPIEVTPLPPPVFAPAPRNSGSPVPPPPPDRLGPTVQTGSFWAGLKSLFKKAS